MLSLLINSQPAHLTPGTSIRLTRVNPFFEDQGDYTLEVQLPLLNCPENQKIFGPLHRPEQALHTTILHRLPMQLIAPPLHLQGYALVTSITDQHVKVQLIAGRSALNHAIDQTAIYIDALPLGNCWDTYAHYTFNNYQSLPDQDEYHSGRTIDEQKKVFRTLYAHTTDTDGNHLTLPTHTLRFGLQSQTDSLCFPIISTTDDDGETMANNEYTRDPTRLDYHIPPSSIHLAPQPYLLDITRRILKAAGYEAVDFSLLPQDLIPYLFIANTRQTLQRAKTLPHWTLSEYLQELQNLLSIVFTVTPTNTIRAIPRSQYFTSQAPIVPLHADASQHTADIDQTTDTTTNPTDPVTDYDHQNISPILHLPEEVFERATIHHAPTYEAIRRHFEELHEDQRALSNILYVDDQSHQHYAILHHPPIKYDALGTPYPDTSPTAQPTYHLYQVDQFSPLSTDPTTHRSATTTLRILPCPMTFQYFPGTAIETYTPIPPNYTHLIPTHHGYDNITSAVPILTAPTPIYVSESYSIDNAINPSDDTDDQPSSSTTDRLYIAYYHPSTTYPTPHTTTYGPQPTPISIPYDLHPLYNLPTTSPLISTYPSKPSGPFTLADPSQPSTIAHLHANQPNINTRLEHHIPIILPPTIDPSPTRPYLINSRLYACHKLELTLTPSGLSPLIQGHFYEINPTP